MAEDRLIERYLDALRARLRHRRDVDDLIDEVADHLSCTVERLHAGGMSRHLAAREALERIGDADSVAIVLSSVPFQGSRIALLFSRRCGALCAVAAVVWFAAGIGALYGYTAFGSFHWSDEAYYMTSAVLAAAILTTTVALVGMNIRSTGEVDDPTMAIGLLGTVASFLGLGIAWMFPVWLGGLSLLVTWTVVRTWRAGVGSRATRIAVSGLLPLVSTGMLVAGFVVSGPRDGLLLVLVLGTTALLAVGYADFAIAAGVRGRLERALTA